MINISDPAKRKILGSKDSKNVILGRLLSIRSLQVMLGEMCGRLMRYVQSIYFNLTHFFALVTLTHAQNFYVLKVRLNLFEISN